MNLSVRHILNIAASLAAIDLGSGALRADDLAESFSHPPESAKPRTWVHCLDGNVTAPGLIKDLQAMKRVGLGEAQIFSIAWAMPKLVDTPVVPNTAPWRQIMKQAAEECQRLDMQLAFHNSAGWSETGGPWVTPPQAMQKLVWSRLQLQGPQHFSARLPAPPDTPGPFLKMLRHFDSPKFYPLLKPYYADSALLAYRLPDPPLEAAPKVQLKGSAASDSIDVSALVDEQNPNDVNLPVPAARQEQQTQYITYEYAQPLTCRSLVLQGDLAHMTAILEVSLDGGKTYEKLLEIPGKSTSSALIPRSFAVNPTTSRHFRLALSRLQTKQTTYPLRQARPSAHPCVDRWEEKAGFALMRDLRGYDEAHTPAYPPQSLIQAREVIDLTGKLQSDGTLQWDVPPGNWCLLRLGHSPTGRLNTPAAIEATGHECDKLSAEAVTAHFHAVMDPLKKDLGPLMGQALKNTVIDSWEADCLNWTPKFIAEFQQRRGYNPLPYLPVMTGEVVESPEVSERFLWDVRRTIADLLADNHYGVFTKLCHEIGLEVYAEAVGIGQAMADQLQCKGRVDIPMGEFWAVNSRQRFGPTQDPKEAAVAAHIYGKKFAAAEAFTGGFTHDPWTGHPYSLKAQGDLNFCLGINRFVFHTYTHQPLPEAKAPGATMWRFGTHMERTVTWWENAAPAYMSYLARCEQLLQSGLFVGDLCYMYGEGAPATLKEREDLAGPDRTHNYDENRGIFAPSPPKGYDYDACNAEVLLTRMSARDGRLVLPDGMGYRLLVLSPDGRMTLPVAQKVRQLVADGALVYGPRPHKSPSLRDYPQGDAEIEKIAAEVWGDCDGKAVTEHAFGRGRIFWGKTITEVLAGLNLPPDVDYQTSDAKAKWAYIHRVDGPTEIYFISNQQMETQEALVTFRVSGKVPELWHPETGETETLATYRVEGDRTRVPLRLDPAGSVFVIFRQRRAACEPIVALSRDGKALQSPGAPAGVFPVAQLRVSEQGQRQLLAWQNGAYELQSRGGKSWPIQVANLPSPSPIEGPWDLRFPPNLGAPESVTLEKLESWTQHAMEGVKYFSGTASYHKEIEITQISADERLYLDLGAVREIPELLLNGQSLGVLWKPPYRWDITRVARAGKNQLEIKVTNLWPNRLIGDWKLPEEKRVTWTTYPMKNKTSPLTASSSLLESGLLGPVQLVKVAVRKVDQ